MIKTTAMMLDELNSYASPKTKLSRMVKSGECFQIVRGLYETSKNVSPHFLAGSIYGPSYVSFEYALSYYGYIPEMVHVVTCACYDKKKKKKYDTPMGSFTYRDVPTKAFPYALRIISEGDYYCRIASPEKALCDLLYIKDPVGNTKELSHMLLEDLRIDETKLRQLDLFVIQGLCDQYHSTNVKKLVSLLRRFK